MLITRIRLERRTLELDPPFFAAWDPDPRRSFEATLVFVETDVGVTGVGSGDTMDGFERYEERFTGRDPLEIDRHVLVLETIAFHAARYWPLEAALWDLAGKAEGKPVAELLGGGKDRVPAYASTGDRQAPSERAESALALRDEGFKALKIRIDGAQVDEGVAAVVAVREAVGDTMGIMVDLNQGWRMPGDLSPALARDSVHAVAERLRDLDVVWLEEPFPRENVEGYAALRAEVGIRVAGGEMAQTTADLEGFEAADALDVYQPGRLSANGPASRSTSSRWATSSC